MELRYLRAMRGVAWNPQSWPPGHFDLWIVDLTNAGAWRGEVGRWLSTGELDRAGRFRTSDLSDRFILGRAGLRCLLGGYLKCLPSDVPIGAGSLGKPFVVGVPELQFNVSHSEARIVYVVSARAEIGVDIEPIREIPELASIIESHFGPGERAELTRGSARERLEKFYFGWTRKEAVLKALGIGLGVALDRFEVGLEPPGAGPVRLKVVADCEVPPAPWTLHAFTPEREWTGAVALRIAGGCQRVCRSCDFRTLILEAMAGDATHF